MAMYEKTIFCKQVGLLNDNNLNAVMSLPIAFFMRIDALAFCHSNTGKMKTLKLGKIVNFKLQYFVTFSNLGPH